MLVECLTDGRRFRNVDLTGSGSTIDRIDGRSREHGETGRLLKRKSVVIVLEKNCTLCFKIGTEFSLILNKILILLISRFVIFGIFICIILLVDDIECFDIEGTVKLSTIQR